MTIWHFDPITVNPLNIGVNQKALVLTSFGFFIVVFKWTLKRNKTFVFNFIFKGFLLHSYARKC